MQEKILDHIYHRTRVDAQITGSVLLVGLMAVLAVTIGDRFEPLHPGANLFESAWLVWVEHDQTWVTQSRLLESGNFPPPDNQGPLITREIAPISISMIVVLGALAAAFFNYLCARRQTRLLNSVYANEPNPPYQRPWREIRMTFWALDLVLAFILFYLIS